MTFTLLLKLKILLKNVNSLKLNNTLIVCYKFSWSVKSVKYTHRQIQTQKSMLEEVVYLLFDILKARFF